jgi:dCTP diphosphatase
MGFSSLHHFLCDSNMSDTSTTVGQLREMVRTFVDERQWQEFHNPKNLCMAMSIEVAELMEHFQWLTLEEARAVPDDPQTLANVGEELADVICYAMALANELKLDIATTMQAKMVKNIEKYPAPEFQGKYKK